MFQNTAESLVAERDQQSSCSTLGTDPAEYTQNRKFSKWLWQLWEQVQFSKVKASSDWWPCRRSFDDKMSWCPNQTGARTRSPLTITSSLVTSVALHICGLFFPIFFFFFKESNNDVEDRRQNLNLTSDLCLTGTIRNTFHLAAANVRCWLLLEQVKHTVDQVWCRPFILIHFMEINWWLFTLHSLQWSGELGNLGL